MEFYQLSSSDSHSLKHTILQAKRKKEGEKKKKKAFSALQEAAEKIKELKPQVDDFYLTKNKSEK